MGLKVCRRRHSHHLARMKTCLILAIVIAVTSAGNLRGDARRLTKRSPALPLLGYKSGGGGGGDGANRLPSHLDPNIGNSAAMMMQYMAAVNRYRGLARSSSGGFVPAYIDSAAKQYGKRR